MKIYTIKGGKIDNLHVLNIWFIKGKNKIYSIRQFNAEWGNKYIKWSYPKQFIDLSIKVHSYLKNFRKYFVFHLFTNF